MLYIIETTETYAGTKNRITNEQADMCRTIIEDRESPKVEKVIDEHTGFILYDENEMPLVAMHWQHSFNHMVAGTTIFTECRYRILPHTYAETPIVPIKPRQV